jgi:hypothetical protein
MALEQVVSVHLVPDVATNVSFDDVTFRLTVRNGGVRVALDDDNYALVRRRSQSMPAEAAILEGQVVYEERLGEIDYERYFLIDWEDAMSHPELTFRSQPREVTRHYAAGQSIELGVENVARYRVVYPDGVEAVFERTGEASFRFNFSTGFHGDFWRDPDDTYTLRFRGDRMVSSEEAHHSQSKFIISRCKHSGNLLLILQDEAEVFLT